MGGVKDFVDQTIASRKVVVFSKTGCPYCTKAKTTLSKYVGDLITAADYLVVEIDNRPDCQEIQDYLLKITGGRSVPRVFINQKFVGGGDDVVAKDKSGELKTLLSA